MLWKSSSFPSYSPTLLADRAFHPSWGKGFSYILDSLHFPESGAAVLLLPPPPLIDGLSQVGHAGRDGHSERRERIRNLSENRTARAPTAGLRASAISDAAPRRQVRSDQVGFLLLSLAAATAAAAARAHLSRNPRPPISLDKSN